MNTRRILLHFDIAQEPITCNELLASSCASNDPDPTIAVIHRRQEFIMIHVLPSCGTICIDCTSYIDCISCIDCTSYPLNHTHASHAWSTHTCFTRKVDIYMLHTHVRLIHASHACSTCTCFTCMVDKYMLDTHDQTYMLDTHGRHIHVHKHDRHIHARHA